MSGVLGLIVFGAMEATLTPLMERIERDHAGIKVFSLPSVDHPQYGRHIELGVKGAPQAVTRSVAATNAAGKRWRDMWSRSCGVRCRSEL